jgi:hypothetical protein
MKWQKVSREKFQFILDKEIATLPPEAANRLMACSVSIFEQPFFRSEDYGVEKVFVIARSGNRVLFFDDVEEEFGVGIPDRDGILRCCGTFGPLAAAARALDEGK